MTNSKRATRGQNIARLTIAPLFLLVGVMHLTRASSIAPLMPSVVPHPLAVISLTVLAEMAGAVGLFIPCTRVLAAGPGRFWPTRELSKRVNRKCFIIL